MFVRRGEANVRAVQFVPHHTTTVLDTQMRIVNAQSESSGMALLPLHHVGEKWRGEHQGSQSLFGVWPQYLIPK